MTRFNDLFQSVEAVIVVKIFIVVCLIVLAVYTVLKVREFASGGVPRTGEYVTDFESMKEQGLLDEKELSEIKNAVGKVVDHSPVHDLSAGKTAGADSDG